MSAWSAPTRLVARLSRAALLALIVVVGCAPVYTSSSVDGVGAPPPAVRPDPEPRVERPPTKTRSAEAAADLALADVLGSLVWPLPVRRARSLTSGYGLRIHPVRGGSRFHAGIDIRSPDGAPVYAAADGTVTSSGASGAYGLRVVVDHGAGLSSLYAHASRILVDEGDRVLRGEPIALVGATGNATGPHLHFELRWGGGTVDPREVLPGLSGASSLYAGR